MRNCTKTTVQVPEENNNCTRTRRKQQLYKKTVQIQDKMRTCKRPEKNTNRKVETICTGTGVLDESEG